MKQDFVSFLYVHVYCANDAYLARDAHLADAERSAKGRYSNLVMKMMKQYDTALVTRPGADPELVAAYQAERKVKEIARAKALQDKRKQDIAEMRAKVIPLHSPPRRLLRHSKTCQSLSRRRLPSLAVTS